MRRILTAACALLFCAGCGSATNDVSLRSAGPSCASRITWHGAVYYGSLMKALPPATLTLGTGGRPTCRDSNGGEAGASSTVQVRRLIGVDPRVAVAVRGEPDVAYLAPGWFVQLPSHPLHGATSWSPRLLNELHGCAKTARVELEGIVLSYRGFWPGLDVTRQGRSARGYVGRVFTLFVDGNTRLDSLSRLGLPYLAAGKRVSVEANACLTRAGKLAKLVPRRISPA